MPAVTIFMIMADLLRDMTKSTVKEKKAAGKPTAVSDHFLQKQ